jgi:general secretion pathway protein K
MKWERPSIKPLRKDRGFALVIVLWIAGLLAAMTTSFSMSVNTHIRVAANIVESAKAEALADAGAMIAMMDVVASRQARSYRRRFPADGSSIACSIPDEGGLSISVTDEAGRIDANAAGTPILQALMIGLGEAPQKAAKLADAILDFRDSDDERMPNGAESAEYRSAGIGWLPKNAPLQTLDELGQVYGMTPQLLARMRPYLGLHSGLAGVDVNFASPKLIDLLRSGLEGAAGSFGSFPEMHGTVALPAMFVSPSQQRTFILHAEARTSTGAVFVREAVVGIGFQQARTHVFFSWTRGRLTSNASAAGGLAPPC